MSFLPVPRNLEALAREPEDGSYRVFVESNVINQAPVDVASPSDGRNSEIPVAGAHSIRICAPGPNPRGRSMGRDWAICGDYSSPTFQRLRTTAPGSVRSIFSPGLAIKR